MNFLKVFLSTLVFFLVNSTLLVQASISSYGWRDVYEYPGAKTRSLKLQYSSDLNSLPNYDIHYADIINKYRDIYYSNRGSYDANEQRPESYNLQKHDGIKFLKESYYPVGAYGGVDGVVSRYEPYEYGGRTFGIVEYIIPEEYVDKLYVSVALDGGTFGPYHDDDDDGAGFILVLLNDTDVIYYADSYRLLDDNSHYSEHPNEFLDIGVTFGINKAAKISVILYTADPHLYQEQSLLREYPTFEERKYEVTALASAAEKIGDNTNPQVLYTLKNKIPSRYSAWMNAPLWADAGLSVKVNNTYVDWTKMSDLTTGYVMKNGQPVIPITVRAGWSDSLTGTRGARLGYGILDSYDIPIDVPQGVPVLSNLLDIILGKGYTKETKLFMLSDDNRLWDINDKNRDLVAQIKNALNVTNSKLFMIGSFNPDLFGPLLE